MSAATRDSSALLQMQSPPAVEVAGRGGNRTLLDLLTEKMDGGDRQRRMRSDSSAPSKWKILKQRLGLNTVACCGATWRYESSPENLPVVEESDQVDVTQAEIQTQQNTQETTSFEPNGSESLCTVMTPSTSAAAGMNLGAALAAERQFRLAETTSDVGPRESLTAPCTPSRVPLMRLLAETAEVDGGGDDDAEEREKGGSERGCCVCMVRKKGAALIPCGHTFCRVCSRELWVNRGTCPLCNRTIIEILDIF